jgi:preprotein translocase subunit SecD
MTKRIRVRLVVILFLCLLSVYLFAGFPPSMAKMQERIHLGLDLKGGILLELEVVTDDAIRAETDQTIESVRELLRKENVAYRQLTRRTNDSFVVVDLDPTKESQVRETVAAALPDWDVGQYGTVKLKASREAGFREQAVDLMINAIRNRIDVLGVSEPTIQRYGGAGTYQILVQLPGVDDMARVKSMMLQTALLEWKLVESGPFTNEPAAKAKYGGTIPSNFEVLPYKDRGTNSDAYYVVQRTASVTGRDLRSAFPSRDNNGRPAVGFTLTAESSQRMARVTEQNVGRQLAIVLDGKIQSAPQIHTRISDSGIIEGGPAGFAPQEAQDLSTMLRSGALPASIKYLREEKVSATLGADSIRAGVMASAIALVLVVTFMLFYYRLSGINATVALALNLLILLGAMAYFGVTLTLPGIAGITLTIGVGIDSNVLIFERIREELRSGKTAIAAVTTSFSRVFITLVDTHLAALISAVFLFLFGTGPVKGFAVTLVIGLVSNMFTAVFVSRTLFEYVLARRKARGPLSI